MSKLLAAETASSTSDSALGSLKKGENLNDILGLLKKNNKSKIRADKEEFYFKSIIYCNPDPVVDLVGKKRTLVQAGRGMISLARKRPVVEFKTVEIDEHESKYRTHCDTVHEYTSAITTNNDEKGSSETFIIEPNSCNTRKICSHLESSPISTKVRKRRRRKRRKALFEETIPCQSMFVAKKIKFESTENVQVNPKRLKSTDNFDDSNTFANCSNNSSLAGIDLATAESGITNSELDMDCYIIDRSPNDFYSTEFEKVATAESEITNLEFTTSFYTIDRQPDYDTYLSKSVATPVLESRVIVSELDTCCREVSCHPENIYSIELPTVKAMNPKTTNLKRGVHCHTIDRVVTDTNSTLSNGRTGKKCLKDIDEGESPIKKMRSRLQEARKERINEFESDLVEGRKSKKRKRRGRKRKRKNIDPNDIFQMTDATRRKIVDFVNTFISDP